MRRLRSYANLLLTITFLIVALPPTAAAVAPSNDMACSSLKVQTDKESYTVSETVVITVDFNALLPGCVEPMIAHNYVITIQVLNSENSVVISYNRTTSGGAVITETWTPTVPGDYSVNATSWFRLLGNDFMTKTLQASKLIHVEDSAQSTMQGWLAPASVAILVASLGFWIFKKNRMKQAH